MDLNAKLEFNVVAVDQGETVHLLLEMAAPELEGERRRDPAHLQVVLDRSGSMATGKLYSALTAIDSLVGRLRADDRFGLVTFDNGVEIPVAGGAVGDGSAIRSALHQVHVGGMTNLSGGLVRGVQECQRISDGSSSTLVLLSDGHANRGIVDHAMLGSIAHGAQGERITVSTIGIGLDYDEDLLEAISVGGSGNAHFAETGDEAGAQLASEVDGLLEQVAQAASLTVKPGDQVSQVRLFNDLPVSGIEGGFMVELGEFSSEETRRLLFEIDVPEIATLGLAQVCEIELRWIDTETMESKLATIPVNVNVVPGDQAAGRVRDNQVETEISFQTVQRQKRDAEDALKRGDIERAREIYENSSLHISSMDRQAMSRKDRQRMDEELTFFDRLDREAVMDAKMAIKRSKADFHQKTRRRRNPRER